MKTSDSIAKIAPALLKAQKLITFASKDSANPFFKSKYADLPTVIDAIKQHLNDNDIMFIQTIDSSTEKNVADFSFGEILNALSQYPDNSTQKAKIMSAISDQVNHGGGHIRLTTRIVHSSGEWIEGTATMPIVKNDPQAYGSAATYARRYSLAAIVGLYQDDDDANAATHQVKKEAPKAKTSVSNETFEKLSEDEKVMLKDLSIEIIDCFVKGDMSSIMDMLDSVIEQDYKVGLWSLLPSNIRAGIKKFKGAE